MILGPALVLSLLVGLFHVCLYVLIRGRAGQRLPLLAGASVLGAWAGDALAARIGADPLRIGDYHLIGASILAWVGIVLVAIVAVLAQREARAPAPPASVTEVRSSPVERP